MCVRVRARLWLRVHVCVVYKPRKSKLVYHILQVLCLCDAQRRSFCLFFNATTIDIINDYMKIYMYVFCQFIAQYFKNRMCEKQ